MSNISLDLSNSYRLNKWTSFAKFNEDFDYEKASARVLGRDVGRTKRIMSARTLLRWQSCATACLSAFLRFVHRHIMQRMRFFYCSPLEVIMEIAKVKLFVLVLALSAVTATAQQRSSSTTWASYVREL
ncbi:MAG TPA: hypothetical protein VGQ41_13795 [Pyrinomonadaceae bacterium]|jgi:hypothetical protein|nr:hypothetical protein [Pyrinomonadaceae bacterium]